VFELLDEKPRGKHCAGMAGILEEGSDTMQEDAEDTVMDAMLIASGQRVEHYEITAYGTVIAWAQALGLTEVAEVLGESLAEEKAADEKLSALAESGINDAATAGESEDEVDEDADEPESRSTTASDHAETGARSAKRGGRR
jgi:ferritin-like metal-binding protein YciE